MSIFLPIIMAFVFSVALKPLFLTRYLILTIPSLYLFFSWFFAAYPAKLGNALKIVLVGVMLLTLANQARSSTTPVRENYKDVAQYLSQKATAQDVIVISAPFTVYPVEYYYDGPANMATLPIWDRFKSGAIPVFSEQTLPSEVDQIKGSHQLAYVVLSYNQGYESNIKTYFDTHFQRVDQKRFSNDLNVYVYKLRYDSTTFDKYIKIISNEPATANQPAQP
jgi:hypothetical protein